MSTFLPDNQRRDQISTPPPQTTAPDQQTIKEIKRLFGAPQFVPETFLGYIVSYLEANFPYIPISNIAGAQLTTAKAATQILTSQTTTSATYGNLATVGPELTGLANGLYVVTYGATIQTSVSGQNAYANVASNSVDPVNDDDAIDFDLVGGHVPASKQITRQLAAGSNTLRMRYRVLGGATGTFSKRWMTAIRVGN